MNEGGSNGHDAERDPGAAPPVGTVTLLLADQEGSSLAWESDPETAAVAVGRAQAIIDEQVGCHGGVRPIEQGEGDSFVAAFARASDALGCAVAIQLAMGSEDSAGPAPRFRMALHTGEVQLRDDGNYMGGAINRCGRLRALASGAQILLSRTTADVVADRLPEGVSLLDLGVVHLRDLSRPEQVFQVLHPDLPGRFPPLRDIGERPGNLPTQLSSFIGRQRELRDVTALLEDARLVTLLGAGGSGKTRLALQAAADADGERFGGGVWFVDLAPVSQAESVADAVATALALPSEGARPPTDRVVAHLRTRNCLVVLDNCEHVVGAAAGFAQDVLTGCPGVTVLATSRQPLDVAGERSWRVPCLDLPRVGETPALPAAGDYDAIKLFVVRAIEARPGFVLTNENAAAVIEICRRLDGIPLAIELAAARVRLLSPAQLATGLDDRFRLLGGGPRTAVPRQQTLAASVAWSHDLLDPLAQVLLRRLSIFAGGWTLQLAEQVCGSEPLDPWQVLDLLSALVDASMVQVEDVDDIARYRMLETIRQFGSDRLQAAAERDDVADRLLGALVGIAERVEPELTGVEPAAWLDVLAAEHANFQTALAHAVAADHLELARRLAAALAQYWYIRGHVREGARWSAPLWEGATDLDPQLETRLAWGVAQLSVNAGDHERAARAGARALEVAAALADPIHIGRAHNVLGFLWLFPDTRQGLTHFEASVGAARLGGDGWAEADSLAGLGLAQTYLGQLDQAKATLREATLAASGRAQPLAEAAFAQGWMYVLATDRDPEAVLVEARRLAERVGDVIWVQLADLSLGEVARRRGATASAIQRLETVLVAGTETGSPFSRLGAGLYLAQANADAGDLAGATSQLGGLVAEAQAEFMTPYVAQGLIALSRLLSYSGAGDAAVERAEEALVVARDSGYAIFEADGLSALAAGWLTRGDAEQAEDLAHEALRRHVALHSVLAAADDLDLLAEIAAGQASDGEALRLASAAESLRRSIGLRLSWSPRHVGLESDALQRVASRLGKDAADRAVAEGSEMDLASAAAYAARGRGERDRPSSGWSSLTPTEVEVVRLVAQGLTNPKIADRLFIGRETVKSHLAAVFAKLGVATRAELATLATRRGL